MKLLIFLSLMVLVGTGSRITYALNELELRAQGINYFDPGGTGGACSTVTSTGAGGAELPLFIPEPLRTILIEAALAHNTDPVLLSVLYVIENGLQNGNQYLTDDWLIGKMNTNGWSVNANSGAAGPFQFIPTTWDANKQEGPFIFTDGAWTSTLGASDGININHIDDAAFSAAALISSMGVTTSTPLGSFDQDFPKSTPLVDTIAGAVKGYNAGQFTYRENGIWLKNDGSVWAEAQQTQFNNYLQLGLEIYTKLSGGGGGGSVSSGCNDISLGNIGVINVSAQAAAGGGLVWLNRPPIDNVTAIALHWTAGSPDTTIETLIGVGKTRSNTPDKNGNVPTSCCGYQFFVRGNGEIYQLVDPAHLRTAHISSWNDNAIGIGIAAGSDGTVATADAEINSNLVQREAVVQLVLALMNQYNVPAASNFPLTCPEVNAFPPTGLIGHIDYPNASPCNGTKVGPSSNYLELIRGRVSQ